jgi:Uma2 family endonuclease
MSIEPLELAPDERGYPQFNGVRMTADDYFELPDDGFQYELVHGVLVLSPRPMPWHQSISGEIYAQLHAFLSRHAIGQVFMEVDVRLGPDESGEDLVYAPDVVFMLAQRIRSLSEPLSGPPELVVEVISRGSRRMDTITKRADYERAGVGEYWILDPQRQTMTFLRLQDGRFVEVAPDGDTFRSHSVPGFVLNLKSLRSAFKA